MRPGSSNGVFFIFFPKPQKQETHLPYLILILSSAARLLLNGCNPWIATAYYICIACQWPVSNYNPSTRTAISSRCHALPFHSIQAALPAAWSSPGDGTSPSSYNTLLEDPSHFWAKTRAFLCHPHTKYNPETLTCLFVDVSSAPVSLQEASLVRNIRWLDIEGAACGGAQGNFLKAFNRLKFLVYLGRFKQLLKNAPSFKWWKLLYLHIGYFICMSYALI